MITDPTFQLDTIQLAKSPTLKQIATEWNANVDARARELETETDVSYFTVIIPYIYSFFRELNLSPGATILDLGCGLGHLTHLLSSWGYKVVGIDIADKA